MEQIITRTEWELVTSPCVYVCKQKGVPIYIGCSEYGYRRIFSFCSTQRNRIQAMKEQDEVRITYFATVEDASRLETEWIHKFHPKWNRICMRCGYYTQETLLNYDNA